MACATDMTVTMADGRPLAVLQQLVAKRMKVFGENAKDASIATLITGMKSIRAATRKGKKTAKKVTTTLQGELSIAVSECPELVVSVRRGKVRVCDRGGHARLDIRPWFQVAHSPEAYKTAKVYRITLSADRLRAWPKQRAESYMIAANAESARRIVQARYDKLAARYSSLGRDTLGKCMQLLSSRPAAYGGTSKAQAVMNRAGIARVVKSELGGGGSGSFNATVMDNLVYATEAVSGGASGISSALARAANSVNGMINKYIQKHSLNYFSDAAIAEKPFPESFFNPEGATA